MTRMSFVLARTARAFLDAGVVAWRATFVRLWWRRSAVPLKGMSSGRSLLSVAASAFCAGSSGCTGETEVMSVVLEPVLALAIADVIDDKAELSFSFVDDGGKSDGVAASKGRDFALSHGTQALSFEVHATDQGFSKLLALGRTGFLSVRDDDGLPRPLLRVPVLLSPVDAVGLLRDDLPGALGGDECVAADERGRLFVVGGRLSLPGAYLVEGATVTALPGASSLAGQAVASCAAWSGRVAAVAGCGQDTAVVVVVGELPQELALRAVAALKGMALSCAARVAPADGGVWVADGARLFFLSDNGSARELSLAARATPSPGIVALAATNAGEAVVIDGTGANGVFQVVSQDEPARVVRTGLSDRPRLGRRFADILLWDGDVLIDEEGRVVRAGLLHDRWTDDDDEAEGLAESSGEGGEAGPSPLAFTVLSDDTLVVLGQAELDVSPSSSSSWTSVPLSVSRAGLAALPGDTLVLSGGGHEGVDVVALSAHRVRPR
jgi:hypothetical protein